MSLFCVRHIPQPDAGRFQRNTGAGCALDDRRVRDRRLIEQVVTRSA